MKAMPLPFEDFQGKGVLGFSTAASSDFSQHHHRHHQQSQKWHTNKENCYVGTEPTSVLDTRRSPSPPTSTSTLSSSLGNGGSGSTDTNINTTGVAAAAAAASENPSQTGLDIGEKCGLGMEDWEGVLSESSPGQEQSILRMIMGDIEDPSVGLNKLLQGGSIGSHQDLEFNAGFGIIDQATGFGFEPISTANSVASIDPSLPIHSSDFPFGNARLGSISVPNPNPSPFFSTPTSNALPVSLPPGVFLQQQLQAIEAVDEKPQIFNPQVVINQNQAQYAQNQALFMPLTYANSQEHHLLSPPPAKRLNSGTIGANYQVPKVPFSDSGQELFLRGQQQQQGHMLSQHSIQQRPMMVAAKQKMVNNEFANHQQQLLHQEIVDQLVKAAELIETGNPALAQGILARLNHQLSPIGKPFQRAAFYFMEALQLLLHMNTTGNSFTMSPPPPISLIFKIGAYKSFSEISPVLQFANFTCNQALLEALEGCDRIHVVDFDIGFGGQWASFMQELALRNGGSPGLKITAFSSPSTHDELELGFTQENLKHFASEINIAFEFEILSLDSLNSGSWPLPLRVSETEAIAVNLPIASFSNYPSSLPSVLRFVKQLSPKIMVSLDRGCDRTDVPLPHHIVHAIQSYSSLLESLDAINVNHDTLQKIERHLLQPGIEKIVLGRHRSPERTPPWKNLFLSSGFSPLTFSNFTESQAEYLVQRIPARGFHVEKKQASLVLCWQRKELISASAWKC
ncbi:scarecrow-like protein 22 isoform X1 [Juglans microcarpa x Juglans regia]|uniref:scarecrow-like protein 22 isoform X1 n=1 Tax=Juglans microcarpa x Juglans regia TaxID=2249226 RepID=UPI001B7E887F|nr:scarecrow-like protein 22 isoform X1 [Juglans microcarpa x Juglans regia]